MIKIDPFWEFFLSTVYYFYFGFITLIIILPIGFIWFWKKKLPKPARTLFWCAIKGYAPLLLVHDSGRADIVGIKERKEEGIVETTAGTFKILPRYAPLLSDKEMEELGSQDPAMQILKDVGSSKIKLGNREFIIDPHHWVAKRSWLVGMPTPLFVGYTGSLCILNPEALALFEAADLKIDTGTEVHFNPHNIKKKDEDDAVQPLLLLDPRKIGTFIYKHFHTSQIAGVLQAAEERARLMMGSQLKRIGTIILIVLAVFGLILLILYLPQLMQRFGR